MIFLEGGLDGPGIMILVLSIMLGPPILLSLIGLLLRKNNAKTASKVFFILAVVYLIVGLGMCSGVFL